VKKQNHVAVKAFSQDDCRVMTFRQWIELNGISPATGKRLLSSGEGPERIQLSQRRVGITVAANKRWQESRAR
jgi:predicted DNA-binding transcriptional regulator AlpA